MTDLGKIWGKFLKQTLATYKGKKAEVVLGGVLYERMFYTEQQWHELIDKRYAEGVSAIKNSLHEKD